MKATWAKTRGMGLRRGGWDRWGRPGGVKMDTTVLEQLKKRKLKNI